MEKYECMYFKNKSQKKQLTCIKNKFKTLTYDHNIIKKELEVVSNENNLALEELKSMKVKIKTIRTRYLDK